MKIMVKGESDPARALHRIADYISENYPEGTVLPVQVLLSPCFRR